MKLPPAIHGVLDYATVAGFAALPTLSGLEGEPAQVCYGLAGIHLFMTLVTRFPMGVVKLLPLPLHGAIEFLVGPALIALPWVRHYDQDPVARNVFIGAGAVIFVVWLLSGYRVERRD
jgi:hypothetical protein